MLYGDGGNDTLQGGAGADLIDGGSGTDTASYASSTKGVTVSLTKPSINTNDAQGDTFKAIENLLGSKYNDVLYGNTAANSLTGGAGDDKLYGDGGNDRLYGGLGKDLLVGGAGLDVFVFDTALGTSNVDTISGFSVKDDTIWLDDDVFTKIGKTGDLSPGAFYVGTKANDSTDRVIYNKVSGELWYDADGTGKAAAIRFAVIDKGLALTATDFDIIA